MPPSNYLFLNKAAIPSTEKCDKLMHVWEMQTDEIKILFLIGMGMLKNTC